MWPKPQHGRGDFEGLHPLDWSFDSVCPYSPVEGTFSNPAVRFTATGVIVVKYSKNPARKSPPSVPVTGAKSLPRLLVTLVQVFVLPLRFVQYKVLPELVHCHLSGPSVTVMTLSTKDVPQTSLKRVMVVNGEQEMA